MSFLQVVELSFCILVLVLLSAFTTQTEAANKPWQNEYVSKVTQSLCDKIETLPILTQDNPSDREQQNLKGCDARNLYYGISTPKDYVRARECAFAERANGDDLVIGGSSILMMIYANGYGVTKNLDLALKMACEMGGAGAEIEGRIQHLTELKTKPEGNPLKICIKNNDYPFAEGFCNGKVDICDDITSGYMQGFCALINSDIENAKESATLRKIKSKWPLDQQKIFDELTATADAYFSSHSKNELDLSGTARSAEAITEEDLMKKTFSNTVADLENKRVKVYSRQDFNHADQTLNTTYAATMKRVTKGAEIMGITKEGIRQTQRLWLSYRDAWLKFSGLHYPNLPQEYISTLLTLERTEVLKAVPTL